jgi:hypothetical protein
MTDSELLIRGSAIQVPGARTSPPVVSGEAFRSSTDACRSCQRKRQSLPAPRSACPVRRASRPADCAAPSNAFSLILGAAATPRSWQDKPLWRCGLSTRPGRGAARSWWLTWSACAVPRAAPSSCRRGCSGAALIAVLTWTAPGQAQALPDRAARDVTACRPHGLPDRGMLISLWPSLRLPAGVRRAWEELHPVLRSPGSA